MQVPKFSDFFYPVLSALSGKGIQTVTEIRASAAISMQLSQDAREQRLPSGATVFASRANWALQYLKKAGLVNNPSKGKYQLTEQGAKALRDVGDRINLNFLDQFEGFREFRFGSSDRAQEEVAVTADLEEVVETPEDAIESAYAKINNSLAEELLGAIMEQPPAFFERLVVSLLIKMGYGGAFEEAGKVVGRTNDEGIDGVIREDKLGFSSIYIQAKRWEPTKTVGRPEIQTFVGALAGQQGARKGLFITTAQFTKSAAEYAERRTSGATVVLVDGKILAQLMIENEIGVTPTKTYTIRRLDNDFFVEDGE